MSGIGFFNCREHHVGQRDDCPICRIKELEKQVHDGYEAGWHALRNERDNLKAKLEAVSNGLHLPKITPEIDDALEGSGLIENSDWTQDAVEFVCILAKAIGEQNETK
jgi:hypothetical protein